MPVTVTILYPQSDDFNLDYYVKEHMPMIHGLWTPYGMKGYRITKFIANADRSEPTYMLQTLIEFDSVEQVEKAIGEKGKAAREDRVNFTKVSPTLIVGEEIGRSKM